MNACEPCGTMTPIYRYGFLALTFALCYQVTCWHLSVIVTLLAWLGLGGYYTLYLIYHTLPRDVM